MNQTRVIISLDGDWDFAYTKSYPDQEQWVLPKEEDYEIQIPVPAYWDDCRNRMKYAKFWSRSCSFNPEFRSIEFPMGGLKPPDASLPYLLGTGWYRRCFFADSEWCNKSVTLSIGGVTLEAWVWLNGRYIGHHVGHLTPFEMNLKEELIPGSGNELVIAVSNLRTDRTGCSIRGFKGKSAGITRSVNLTVTGETRIKDCYVRTVPGFRELIWNVEIDGKRCGQHPLNIEWEIVEPDTSERLAEGCAAADEDAVTWSSETYGMGFWSEHHPKRYILRFRLLAGEQIIDETEQMFGLRYIERQERKILINGLPVMLRGMTEHAYFPKTCTVPTDIAYYRHAIKALKNLGYNWLRFHTWTPPEECLEAADQLGMMIQVEAPNGFFDKDFLDIIMTGRKHPSVILYCCGNEVPIDDAMNEKLERMAGYCHSLVPDCLFNPMEALLNIECRLDEEAPGYMTDPVPHNAFKLEKIKKYSDVFSPGVWVFSYHSLYDNDWKIKEKFEIYDRPCLIHEAGINDSYLNLDLEHRYDNTRIGPDLFSAARKYLDEMGLLKNAPVYYQNSCKWMRQIIKFSLEKARRCEYVNGYDFLGAMDCHWHRTGYAVGMLNEFYELKSGFTGDDVRTFNGESVLLSNCGTSRNVFTGDKFSVKLYASLFGGKEVKSGNISWYLEDDDQHIYSQGQMQVADVKNGVITELGEIMVEVPANCDNGKHLKLKADLVDVNYKITNSWDYWAFPEIKETTVETDAMRVVRQIDQKDIDYMIQGGRVLLLSRGSFPGLPITFQIMSGGRVNGNSATVIYDHPLMRDFPHDGFCDWQFYPMIKGGGTILFNHLEVPFDPILEVVSSYKMIRKQASIFELQVGKGGMLVCTLNMNTTDPGTASLYHRMLRYLSSDEFKPHHEVSAGWLQHVMDLNQDSNVDFKTDECYDTGGQIEV